MNSFVGKFVSSVSSGASYVSKGISTAISNATNSPAGSGHTKLTPKEELIQLFEDFCSIVDRLAKLPNSDTLDADVRLNQSPVRTILKKIIYLLQQESQRWIDHQRYHTQRLHSNRKQHFEELEIPCLEYVLQSSMISEIINRALTDTPRGLMPLVLTAISHLLRSVEYPLLPHQTVYKTVAKLISFASRYEFIISEVLSKDDFHYGGYRRRIEIGLTSLLRTIWRKIVENPPVLEFFILTDRRRSLTNATTPSIKPVRIQIDILTGLFPMIVQPKVCYYVQEVLLTALHLGDVKIISYLADHTTFPEMLVKLVCDHYRGSVSVLQQQVQPLSSDSLLFQQMFIPTRHSYLDIFFPPVTSPTPSKKPVVAFPHSPIKAGSALQGVPTFSTVNTAAPTTSTATNTQEMNPLIKFSKSVVFLKAVYSTLRQQHHQLELQLAHYGENDNDEEGTEKLVGVSQEGDQRKEKLESDISENPSNDVKEDSPPTLHPPTTSTSIDSTAEEMKQKLEHCKKLDTLCNRLAFSYYYEFMNDILLPSLESTTNEQQTVIYYYLLQRLLLSLQSNTLGLGDQDDNSFAILSNPQKHRRHHHQSLASKRKRKSSLLFRSQNQKGISPRMPTKEGAGGVAAVNQLVAAETESLMTTSDHDPSFDLLLELFPKEGLLSLTLQTLFIKHQSGNKSNAMISNQMRSKSRSGSIGDIKEDTEKSSTTASSTTTTDVTLRSKSYYQYHNNWMLLLDRTSSMSKVLSMIAIQCITTIFTIAPPIFLMELQSIQPVRINEQEYQQFVERFKQSVTTTPTTATGNITANTTSLTNSTGNIMPTKELWNLRILEEDQQLSVTQLLQKFLQNYPITVYPESIIATTTSTNVSNDPSKGMTTSRGLSSHLVDYTIQQLLQRLFHPGDANYFFDFTNSTFASTSFAHWWEKTMIESHPSTTIVNDTTSTINPTSESYYYIYNDMMIDRFQRRLQSFFTMSIDEQLFFSHFLYQQYLPICLLIMIQRNELLAKQQLFLLMQFHRKILYLLEEMEKKYLGNMESLSEKLQLVYQYLLESAKEVISSSSSSLVSTTGKGTTMGKTAPATPAAKTNSVMHSTPVPPHTPSGGMNRGGSNSTNNLQTPQTPLSPPPKAPKTPTTSTPSITTTNPNSLFKRSFTMMGFGNKETSGGFFSSSTHGDSSSHHTSTTVTEAATMTPSTPVTTTTTANTTSSSDNANPPSVDHHHHHNPNSSNSSHHKEESSLSELLSSQEILRTRIQQELTTSQRLILTSYLLLQEMHYELQSCFHAIDHIKALFLTNQLPMIYQQYQHNVATTSHSIDPLLGSHSIDGINLPYEINHSLSLDVEENESYLSFLKPDLSDPSHSTAITNRWAWKELIVNEYEEDETDYQILKQLYQTITNPSHKNEIMDQEVEFINEYHQIMTTLEQMMSA